MKTRGVPFRADHRPRIALAIGMALAAAGSPAAAQIVSDLEAERPIGIEDARAIPYRGILAAVDWTYNERQGSDDMGPGLSVLYGAARGLEVGAALRYVTSPDRNALRGITSGDLEIHALYALTSESARVPAVAVRVGLLFPTGLDSRGTDLLVGALVTRSFDAFRLHGNARWVRLGDKIPTERADRLEGALGVDFLPSRRGSTDMILLAGVQVRSSPLVEGQTILEAEIGARRRIGSRSVLFAGVGSQLTGEGDRAKARIRAGVSHFF
ncbi:MAG: hypothetical protein ABR576_12890 [Thermoanaerobaculia bacterium]